MLLFKNTFAVLRRILKIIGRPLFHFTSGEIALDRVYLQTTICYVAYSMMIRFGTGFFGKLLIFP